MGIREKSQEIAGDTIVQGVKSSIKKDWEENKHTYITWGLGIIGSIAGVKILFNFIDRPRPQRMNVHFYIRVN